MNRVGTNPRYDPFIERRGRVVRTRRNMKQRRFELRRLLEGRLGGDGQRILTSEQCVQQPVPCARPEQGLRPIDGCGATVIAGCEGRAKFACFVRDLEKRSTGLTVHSAVAVRSGKVQPFAIYQVYLRICAREG